MQTMSTGIAVAIAMLLLAAVPRAESGGKTLTAGDYVEIQQLYARYTHAVDSGNVDAYTALYTEDAVFEMENGPSWRGRKELAKVPGSTLRPRPKMFHTFVNVKIDPSPEGARVTHYAMLTNFQKSPAVTGGAYCDDIVVKTKDGWRIKKKFCSLEPGPPKADGQTPSR